MRWIWTGVMRASSSVAAFALGDGGDDLDDVELDLRAVSFDDLHGWQLSLTLKYPIKSILQHNILWQLTVCISNYGILSQHNARGF